MNLSITGVRLELGRVLTQQSPGLRGGSVHINLSGQQANTLLHDGQAWKEFPRTAPGATRRAIAFEHFMDAFAHRVGRPRPLHLPLLSHLVARAIIREEHMQQTALGMPPRAPSPRVPGWKPGFPDFPKGLDQVIAAWHGEREARMK